MKNDGRVEMTEQYQNPELPPEKRAEDLLSRLSIREKLAQLVCVLPQNAPVTEELRAKLKDGIGEVSTLEFRSAESLEAAAALQRTLQQLVMAESPHHIPAIFHMEGLCGAMLQDAVSFPTGLGRGASFDPEQEEKLGKIAAREERAVGITHVLAPVLDVSRDSRLGRQGETYGEDPTLAAELGIHYTRGVQQGETDGRRSESVAKHFLGFHNSEAGIHGSANETPPRLLQEVYGKPFQAAIAEAGLRGVMPCYCSFDGEPASVSHRFLTELLRQEMGFDGVVAADYSAIANVHTTQKMYESMTETGLAALQAGMDIEMPVRETFTEELADWFAEGKADAGLLDRAVLRVLTAKFRMGLFEHPYALEGEALREAFFRPEDRDVTLTSARESMVLLKNDGVLPLQTGIGKIAVIGPHAANARSFFGGYTHLSMVEAIHAAANSIAGIQADGAGKKAAPAVKTIPGTQVQCDETEEFDQILKKLKPGCRNLLEELQERLPETELIYAYGYPTAGADTSGFAEALQAVKKADLCILTLGGKYGSCSVATMGEGVDAVDINLPECQDAFIRAAAATGVPLVGIHLNGRPVSSDTADRYLSALLEAFSPSEAGAEAIVDVLTGKINPSGRMPVSTARCAGQIPVYYNHPNGASYHQGASIGFQNYVDLPHTPRYFFGYGLSYTTFAYSDLQISKTSVEPAEDVQISCRIANTGSREGTEIVQLYVRDCYASMVRPNLELAGFCRVPLQPEESKQVCFTLNASQLAFLDREYRWKVEKGQIDVLIGASSADLRLQGSFTIAEDLYPEGRNRAFYAKTER